MEVRHPIIGDLCSLSGERSCNVDIVSPDVPELSEPHRLVQFKMDHFYSKGIYL